MDAARAWRCWTDTLEEVRRQAARLAAEAGLQPAGTRKGLFSAVPDWPGPVRDAALCWGRAVASCADADGVWYDVIEGRSARSSVDSVSEAGAWRAEEWLNAFVVLVSAAFTLGTLPCPVANLLEKVLTLGTFSCAVL